MFLKYVEILRLLQHIAEARFAYIYIYIQADALRNGIPRDYESKRRERERKDVLDKEQRERPDRIVSLSFSRVSRARSSEFESRTRDFVDIGA